MSGLQNAMIGLARSATVSRLMRGAGARTALASRFVGGADVDAAVAVARRLFDRHGIRASLFYLGEYVAERAAVEFNVGQALAAAEALGRHGLDVHVSVDPTAIGFMESDAYGGANALRIAEAVARQPPRPGRGNTVMLDMEDLSVRDLTCRLHTSLSERGLPAALTLQGRRRRTLDDLRALVGRPAAVRLVKGAFPEPAAHDHQGRAEIERAYLEAARLMLSPDARAAGFYPSFATHDDKLALAIIDYALGQGWAPDQFEFEMLYGVRSDWQIALRRMGYHVRVYLPFGADWWPYAVRRVGENPRNAWLLARSYGGGGYGID
jgi:proline dehydrogenase